jgi:hypothetical protein
MNRWRKSILVLLMAALEILAPTQGFASIPKTLLPFTNGLNIAIRWTAKEGELR